MSVLEVSFMDTQKSQKNYYRDHSPMTAPGGERSRLHALPADVRSLCGIVQGVLIHRELAAWLYDVKFSPEQVDLANIRPLTRMLAQIRAIDDRPLTSSRDPANRLPSVCRHFSTMLCAILREHGIPSRARCGFAAYFNPGRYEDHWVCEYWNSGESRWVLVDAQVDPQQLKAFRIDFDPCDVPRDRFIVAGRAWQECRSYRADANNFGLSLVPHLRGLWYVAGNLVRDLASLNRMEMLPWDVWGMMPLEDAALSGEQKIVLDGIASLITGNDADFERAHKIYESDKRLHVPRAVFNALRQTTEPIGD